eukprot:gene8553-17876_t
MKEKYIKQLAAAAGTNNQSRPTMAVFDAAKCHLSNGVTEHIRKYNMVPVVIPEGMTSDCQLLDTIFFSQFK